MATQLIGPHHLVPPRRTWLIRLAVLAGVLALALMSVWMQARPIFLGGGLMTSHSHLAEGVLLPGQAVLERPPADPVSPKSPLAGSGPVAGDWLMTVTTAQGSGPPQPDLLPAHERLVRGRPRAPPSVHV